MRTKNLTLSATLALSASMLLSPMAQATGFIFVDPAFHTPIAPPVTPITTTRPGVTPIRPGIPRPDSPVLKGHVSAGLHLETQDVRVEITDQVAKTYIKQTFKNDTDRNLAGTYLFPLPDDATFSSFTLHIDGKPVEGKILAAAEARAQYESIVRRMVDPGLLEYADYKTVRARIFPIPAHGEKKVELEYTQLLKAESGMMKYRFPLKSAGCEAVNETVLDLKLASKQGLRTIWSPTHVISATRDGDHKAKIRFEDKESAQDKDFILYYTLSDSDLAANLLTHKRTDEKGYFLLTLSPPLKAKKIVDKDIVLVADTSGSMRGEKMEQLRKALKYFVESLNSGDRFSLVSFSTDAEAFDGKLLAATEENKKRALEFIEDLEPTGGTNIGDALSIGSEILNVDDAPARPAYLVMMTDGEPTVGETELEGILKTVKAKRDLRLFDFGIGYDVNTRLLNKLAEEHHGTSKYVEPEENLEIALSNFYSKIKSPVLSNLKIAYEGIEVKDIYPRNVKDMFAGTQVTLLGRYKDGGAGSVKLTGDVNGVAKAYSFPLTFASKDVGHSYLPRLWAMRRIGYLTEVAQANDDNKEIVDEIVELSKRHGIISAYTSFLSTDPNESNTRLPRVPVISRRMASPLVRDDLAALPPPSSLPAPLPLVPGGAGGAVAASRPRPSLQATYDPSSATFSRGVHSNRLAGKLSRSRLSHHSPQEISSIRGTSGGGGSHAPAPVLAGGGGSRAARGALMASEPRMPAFFNFSDKQRAAMGFSSDFREGAKGTALAYRSSGSASYGKDSDEKAGAEEFKRKKEVLAKAIRKSDVSGRQAVEIQKTLSEMRNGSVAQSGGASNIKVIGDKTFYFVNGFWVDSGFEKIANPKLSEIKFGSKEYFELVRKGKEMSQYLGAGNQMILVHDGQCYKIVLDTVSSTS